MARGSHDDGTMSRSHRRRMALAVVVRFEQSTSIYSSAIGLTARELPGHSPSSY